MAEKKKKNARCEYTEEFMKEAADYAVLGLQPPQIAERMGLEGRERENFLWDATNPVSPLHELIMLAYEHGEGDLDAALITLAVSGDVDALELALKKREQDKYLQLRKTLFGV